MAKGGIVKVEQWSIKRLVPYAQNPRKNDHAIESMARAITEFGFRIPIIAKSDGTIVDGHLRYKAALLLGLTKVPVMRADDMTEAQIKAFRIAVNQAANWAEWDTGLLAMELGELKMMQFDMNLLGFDDMQLVQFMATPGGLEGADPEAVPEPPVNPVSRAGDIWCLGDHRVMCGDSRNADHVSRLLGKAKINVAFTSPPYAEQREYDQESGFDPIHPDKYVEWFAPVAKLVASHLADDGSWFINIKPSAEGLDTSLYVFDLVLAHVRQWGWHFATEFCWERNGVPKSVTRRFRKSVRARLSICAGRVEDAAKGRPPRKRQCANRGGCRESDPGSLAKAERLLGQLRSCAAVFPDQWLMATEIQYK